jgi:hypothetical protein
LKRGTGEAEGARYGQLAQMKDGPFVGLEAVLMREMSGHQRARVLLRTLVLQIWVVLETNQLALR